ncbi:32260_t:CDS:2, partial [Racocetra persica]
ANNKYPLSNEFLSLVKLLTIACPGVLKAIKFNDGFITIKSTITKQTRTNRMYNVTNHYELGTLNKSQQTEKIEKIILRVAERISLGVGTSKTAIRKWIRIRILQILGVDTDKLEERIFKALLRINFILTNGILSKEELVIVGAIRRFFKSSIK